MKLPLIAIALMLSAAPAMACDDHADAIKEQNRLIREQIRQQERLERLERDKNKMLDRALRNNR